MLTRKQAELLRFIHERLKEAGVPPSFDEMKDALDLRSKSGIHRLITALEERGFIRRLPNRARAIEVIKLPESVAHGIVAGRSRGFTPSVIEGNLGRVRTASEDDGGRPVAVPVMGRIAAGTPIEAIQTRSHTINMPPELLTTGEHFALEVRGDIDKLICHGRTTGKIRVGFTLGWHDPQARKIRFAVSCPWAGCCKIGFPIRRPRNTRRRIVDPLPTHGTK